MKKNFKVYLHGLVVACATAFLTGLGNALSSGTVPTMKDLGNYGVIALFAGVAYLGKVLFLGSSQC